MNGKFDNTTSENLYLNSDQDSRAICTTEPYLDHRLSSKFLTDLVFKNKLISDEKISSPLDELKALLEDEENTSKPQQQTTSLDE
jgi:hypothetical protein